MRRGGVGCVAGIRARVDRMVAGRDGRGLLAGSSGGLDSRLAALVWSSVLVGWPPVGRDIWQADVEGM